LNGLMIAVMSFIWLLLVVSLILNCLILN